MGREHVAIYPGSFDPITLGHLDVLGRARDLFDRVVLAVGQNPAKTPLFSQNERVELARHLVEEMISFEPDGCPVEVAAYGGLTVDFARSVGAVAIVRGIRNVSDVAEETQIAITNREVADIETVFIVTGVEYAYTSSSLIKQIAALGGPLDRLRSLVPPAVLSRLKAMREDPRNPLGRLAQESMSE